jgi:antitoxin (DNA-binding transcriptional repressor) of toxin-antitoxin stability system
VPADFGPIPVGRFKKEASRIAEALEDGRRVLVSKQGRVVSTIVPAGAADMEMVFAYAVHGATEDVLTARVVNQGSPSSYVARAAAGERLLYTKDNKAIGVLQPYDPEGEQQRLETREARLAAYERDHPEATTEEHNAFEDALDDDLALQAEPVIDVASVGTGQPAPITVDVVSMHHFRPTIVIGVTDQLVARAQSRRVDGHGDSGSLPAYRVAEVVEVGSKFELEPTGQGSLPVRKGATIRYRQDSGVALEFGGDTLMILSESDVIEVVPEP